MDQPIDLQPRHHPTKKWPNHKESYKYQPAHYEYYYGDNIINTRRQYDALKSTPNPPKSWIKYQQQLFEDRYLNFPSMQQNLIPDKKYQFLNTPKKPSKFEKMFNKGKELMEQSFTPAKAVTKNTPKRPVPKLPVKRIPREQRHSNSISRRLDFDQDASFAEFGDLTDEFDQPTSAISHLEDDELVAKPNKKQKTKNKGKNEKLSKNKHYYEPEEFHDIPPSEPIDLHALRQQVRAMQDEEEALSAFKFPEKPMSKLELQNQMEMDNLRWRATQNKAESALQRAQRKHQRVSPPPKPLKRKQSKAQMEFKNANNNRPLTLEDYDPEIHIGPKQQGQWHKTVDQITFNKQPNHFPDMHPTLYTTANEGPLVKFLNRYYHPTYADFFHEYERYSKFKHDHGPRINQHWKNLDTELAITHNALYKGNIRKDLAMEQFANSFEHAFHQIHGLPPSKWTKSRQATLQAPDEGLNTNLLQVAEELGESLPKGIRELITSSPGTFSKIFSGLGKVGSFASKALEVPANIMKFLNDTPVGLVLNVQQIGDMFQELQDYSHQMDPEYYLHKQYRDALDSVTNKFAEAFTPGHRTAIDTEYKLAQAILKDNLANAYQYPKLFDPKKLHIPDPQYQKPVEQEKSIWDKIKDAFTFEDAKPKWKAAKEALDDADFGKFFGTTFSDTLPNYKDPSQFRPKKFDAINIHLPRDAYHNDAKRDPKTMPKTMSLVPMFDTIPQMEQKALAALPTAHTHIRQQAERNQKKFNRFRSEHIDCL